MTGTRVKICGLTRPEDAALCASLAVDYLGVIFADSPRKVTPAQAAAIRGAVSGATLVGVFATAGVDEITRTATAAGLDMIQVHGNESQDFCRGLRERTGLPIIKAVSGDQIPDPGSPAEWTATDFFLLDLIKGEPAPEEAMLKLWAAAARASRQGRSVFLAGGLDPHNVRQAMEQAAPFGVDVCRGVEQAPGIKDHGKVTEFMKEVQRVHH
jgi:phosphoribosylanthranilate isomerase